MRKTLPKKAIILFFLILYNSSILWAKGQTISLNFNDVTLGQVFKSIESQTDFLFFYDEKEINLKEKITINVKNKGVTEVLDILFSNKPISYEVKNRHIVLYKRKGSAKLFSNNPQQSSIKIKGQVADESGNPLPGVTVVLKWTTSGVLTDVDGGFEIDVPYANATLEFNYMGFKKVDVSLEGKTFLNIIMSEETTLLTEAVVVGYGTQKKLSVTGSVSSVSVSRVQAISTPSLSNSLVGSMSGIVTRQTSGEPGSDASQIFIRGMGTWVNRNPLTLVDGVERDLNLVNAQEIESITMLKDASATAVYGVRGANGVILITTKRGEEGKPKVVFRTENAMLTALRLPEYINGYQYAKLVNEAQGYAGLRKRYSKDELEKFRTGSDPYFYPNVDWVDMVLKKNTYQTINNLSVSGGSQNVKYYTNVGYTKEMGIYKEDPKSEYNTNANVTRYNFRSNVDISVTKELDINLGIGGIIKHNYYPGVSADRIFYAIKIIPPIQYQAVNPDGSIAGGAAYLNDNPWGLATRSGYSRHDQNSLQGTFSAKWDLSELVTKGLSLKGTFSYDHYAYLSNYRYKEFETKKYLGKNDDGEDEYTVYREGKPMSYSVGQGIQRSVYTELATNYNRSFNEHSVSGLFLFNRREYVNLGTTEARLNLPYRRQGLAGRFTYGFDNRYLLELNFGYNGSENFPKGKRYGFFPSISAGWVVSNEKFWKEFANIDYLKVRASHGQVGNDEIGGVRFMYETLFKSPGQATWFGESQTLYSGIDEYQIGNKDVTWEVATKSNIGIDVNMFKSKLQIQLDGFFESRKGILLQREGTIPEFSGIFSSVIPYANLGRVENKGIDGMIDFNNKSGDFFYSVKGTFTFARNKVLYNDEPTPRYPYLSGVGKRIDQPFGLVAIGFFKDQEDIDKSPRQTFMSTLKAGDVKYKDVNKNGVIDDDDRVAIGNPRTPEIVAGLGGTVGYKNMELSLFFNGVTKTSVFIEGESIYPFSSGLGTYNILKEYYYNRWTPAHTDAKYPAVSTMENPNNNRRSSLFLRDASYVRLKSAEIAYKVPEKFANKMKLEDARIFLNGTNLFTLDKVKIIDPESNYGTGGYPIQRSINFGIQAGF